MYALIAEKNSVARELANVLGANTKGQGFYSGNGYLVSYAVGHLLHLAEAHSYDPRYKEWSINDLPIIPDEFKLAVTEATKEQLKIIRTLLLRDDVDEVICATDAGREGELIFRHIYNFIGCKKPCKRLWISSLTEESILKGMSTLKDIKEYDNLYISAYARAKADWLFGINFTRLFSVKNNNKLPVGRVQTPTLHLVVKRDCEIENFVKEKYFTLKMDNGAFWFKDDCESIKEKSEAEKIKVKCMGKVARVKEINIEKKTDNRPLLYSLTSLQQDANKILGFSAQKTLDVLQTLYEAKLTSYPRTDSNYLTDDMRGDVEATAKILAGFYKPEFTTTILSEGLNLDSRIFNNSKVSDHHAVIPTKDIGKMYDKPLTNEQKALLELIVDRFVIILSVPHIYNLITYVFEVEGEFFKASTKKVLQDGFKRFIQNNKEEKKEKDEVPLVPGQNYVQNDTFTVKNLEVVERITKPKEYFTDASLLSAMENIDREIEDEELKQYVKERGLGTPATRSGIIEKLIGFKYIERKGRHLVSTGFGRKFIFSLPPAVKDIELTANWEQTLLDIEKGAATESVFLKEIIDNVNVVVTLESLKDGERVVADKEVIGECPRCGKPVYESEKVFYCDGYKNTPKCEFTILKQDKFFTDKGKHITKDIAKKLLKDGKVFMKGLTKHGGTGTYDAYVTMLDTGTYINYKLSFDKDEKDSVGVCPRCGKQVFENDKSFYCSGYKDEPKCLFAIWKNDRFFTEKEKKVTRSVVEKLLRGNNVILKGLKSRDGKDTYDAYIRMEDTGKYVNFKIDKYANKE